MHHKTISNQLSYNEPCFTSCFGKSSFQIDFDEIEWSFKSVQAYSWKSEKHFQGNSHQVIADTDVFRPVQVQMAKKRVKFQLLYFYCNILGTPRFESCGVVNNTEKDRWPSTIWIRSGSEDKARRTTAMVFNFLHMQFYRLPRSGLDLDGYIREIGRRQKSFDLR